MFATSDSSFSDRISREHSLRGYATSEWLIFGLYVVVATLAILGNGFVCIVIFKKKLTSNTYVLVANQAMSDLLCGLVFISIWFFCSSKVINLGPIGLLSCESAMVLKLSTFFVSATSMTMLAIVRYRAICKPELREWNPFVLVTSIWTFGLLLGFWQMLNFSINEFFTEDRIFGCRRAFIADSVLSQNHYNFGVTFALTAAIPLLFMGFFYFKVIVRLREIEFDDYSPLKEELEENQRLTKTLICIVIFYFLLGSPVYLFLLADAFATNLLPDSCGASQAQPVYYMVSYWMAASANCVNPFIYCWFSSLFKDEVKRLWSSFVSCLPCVGRKTSAVFVNDKRLAKKLKMEETVKGTYAAKETEL